MYHSKNLTGERKGTFTMLDITQILNVDDNGSFLLSGNILSSGSIQAVRGDFDDLYASSFYCESASFCTLN